MEQVRLFTAIALSFIVFFGWNYFFVDQEPVPVEQTQLSETVQKETAGLEKPEGASAIVIPPKAEAVPGRTPKIYTVDTPLYTVRISDRGAVVASLKLKNYRETLGVDAPLKEMVTAGPGGLDLSLEGASIPGMNEAFFASDSGQQNVTVADQGRSLKFTWVADNGVAVEKTFSFSPDSYLIDYELVLKNGSAGSINDKLVLSMVSPVPEGGRTYGFEGPCALIGGKLEKVKIKKIEDKNIYGGDVSWVAVQDRYFMSSIIPKTEGGGSMRLFLNEGGSMLETQYASATGPVGPGAEKRFGFNLYMGPKSVPILKEAGHKLDKSVNFGMFDIIAKPCLYLMNLIHSFIPNYGIAIILLTILIKIVFWPLGTKSYKSMNEMKKLQPIMAEIREKYKDDKAKMNEEVMGLYKTYKINPMSGCLPMVAQMPIFFALYRMLYEAIELRHAPFVGWITDLSAPDRLFEFGFSIPFMQAPYGIPVLTLVMGGTMFLQQKMQPPAGDPAQAKMMMMMPVVFTFIFINFSSGLVLYWLVNNVLSIAQQYYISKAQA